MRILKKLFPLKRLNTKDVRFEKKSSKRASSTWKVNRKIHNPVIAVELGNIISKNLKNYIKRSKDIPNSYIKLIPTFDYEYKHINFLVEQVKIPTKIKVKFQKKGTPDSYIFWKKGEFTVRGDKSTLSFAFNMIKFLFLIIERDHPYILFKDNRKDYNYSNNTTVEVESRQKKGEELLSKMVGRRV